MIFLPFMTRKEHTQILQLYKDALKTINQEKRELELKIHAQEKVLEAIKELTRIPYPDSAIIRAIERENELIFVTSRLYEGIEDKINIELKLTSIINRNVHHESCKIDACYYPQKSMEIMDIGGAKSCGYGSILMKELIYYCQYNHIPYIYGQLSPVDLYDKSDSNHANRMLHFYSKHGFVITDIPNSRWKSIELDLHDKLIFHL